jgi:hypothetical protein
MGKRILLTLVALLTATSIVSGQQVPDLQYKPPLQRPAYGSGKGPHVVIDEAHFNFHTADQRYKPFAELLRRDGYRVDGLRLLFSKESLKDVDVLVISNALHERNAKDWSPPTPSAFTQDEIAALHTWVEHGGSLFLIVDHAPFPAAASDLAKAFGVEFSNGVAIAGHWGQGNSDTFDNATGLKESAVTRGRAGDEKITKVSTFTGSAFKLPKGATPVLVFGDKSVSRETKMAGQDKLEVVKVPIEGWCQGAVMKVGNGRVAVFGEAGMFTAQLAGPKQTPMGMNAPEAEQNHQLLLNLLHWLSRVKGMPDHAGLLLHNGQLEHSILEPMITTRIIVPGPALCCKVELVQNIFEQFDVLPWNSGRLVGRHSEKAPTWTQNFAPRMA